MWMWMILGWVEGAYDDFLQFFFVYAKYFVALISMTGVKQYLPVAPFFVLHKEILNLESVHGILKYDHSSPAFKSYWAVLTCGTVYYAVQGGSPLGFHRQTQKLIITIKVKATELYLSVVLFAVRGGSFHARIVFGQIYCIALERV